MRLEGHLDQAVETLIAAIRGSEVYSKYLTALEAVKQQAGLKEQIDEYRKKNYMMQSTGDMAFEKIEQFEREYLDFRENPLVSDFLAAELALCRTIQQIDFNITEALNFE